MSDGICFSMPQFAYSKRDVKEFSPLSYTHNLIPRPTIIEIGKEMDFNIARASRIL